MPEIARDRDVAGCGAVLISGANRTTVNGRLVSRLGDGSDHGGEVITASGTVSAEGARVARLGDSHDCPIHGVTEIASASSDTFSG